MGQTEPFYPYVKNLVEASTVLPNIFSGVEVVGGSDMSAIPPTGWDQRLYIQQQIYMQQQIIDAQREKIHRLQQQVDSMSQQLESAASMATEQEEDSELDYSTMNARARVEIPQGVNWKAIPKTRTYSELYSSQRELGVDET